MNFIDLVIHMTYTFTFMITVQVLWFYYNINIYVKLPAKVKWNSQGSSWKTDSYK